MHPPSILPHFDQARLHSAKLKVPMAARNPTVDSLMVAEDICASLKIDAAEATEWTILTSNIGHIEDERFFIVDLDSISEDQAQPISIERCSNFIIRQKGQAKIRVSSRIRKYLTIVDCNEFIIDGIDIDGGKHVISAHNSSNFLVKGFSCNNAEGFGLIIHNCHMFNVSECHCSNLVAAGILIVGRCHQGQVTNSLISHSRGFLNQDAGIHLCCTSNKIAPSEVPEKCHESLSIQEKSAKPHHILIKDCTISNCRAQGIYLEGAINCAIEGNILVGNNKEGVCFDWGSCYNFFRNNIVSLNGRRSDLSEAEIKADFITDYPLLSDGSSSMKLPGISLDNGCMNVIENNTISNNYGGGIKMIRTAMFNVISNNEILYNALGTNKYVPHFHGITALGLGAVNNEFKAERSNLLDFMPSTFNTIAENTITGHWKPIFYDKVSSENNDHDNFTPRQKDYSRFSSVYQKIQAYLLRLISGVTRS